MIKFLDLYRQYQSIQGEVDAAIGDVIRRAAFVGGDDVRAFEGEFAAYQQATHCVGVANGTDAIEIVLEAMQLPPGSEVIVPANSFIASSESVTRVGLRVVFADVDPVSYTLDPADVRRRITPKTKAIIAVHLYGHPCLMDELGAIAKQNGLKLIEDCAQAHGAEYKGRRVGAIGDAGTFSFYPGKNLGAYGDGGAITTTSSQLADQCRMIANHGRIDKYDHRFEGRNSRLDGIQAAVLRVKLHHLDQWIDRRSAVARQYADALGEVAGLVVPTVGTRCRHAFHLFVVRTDLRDALAAHLKSLDIQTGIHYPIALPKLAAYKYLGQATEPMFANAADQTLLSLPMGEHLNDAEVATVASAVRQFFSR